MDARLHIRPAALADAPTLSRLERQCFSDPWSTQGFREVLGTPVCFGLIGEAGPEVQGYLLARAVAGEGEILNLAVVPGARRRGIGGALLEVGLRHLRERGAREVFLEVRESNQAARAMYQSRGFRVVGARQRYYRQPVEDALVFRLPLTPRDSDTAVVDSG
jgi:[ribosomal protein S18]-alanine N-acetyltransferase